MEPQSRVEVRSAGRDKRLSTPNRRQWVLHQHCANALCPLPGLFFKPSLEIWVITPIIQKELRLRGQSEEKLEPTLQWSDSQTYAFGHNATLPLPRQLQTTEWGRQRTPKAAGLPNGRRGPDQRLPRRVWASTCNAETLLPPAPAVRRFLTEIPESSRTSSDSRTETWANGARVWAHLSRMPVTAPEHTLCSPGGPHRT